MNFEHLIQINDPENPLVASLTRDQLWQGLLYRAEDPVPFLPGLESCTILERQANELLRELNFGAATIHDRVTLAAAQWGPQPLAQRSRHSGRWRSLRRRHPRHRAATRPLPVAGNRQGFRL